MFRPSLTFVSGILACLVACASSVPTPVIPVDAATLPGLDAPGYAALDHPEPDIWLFDHPAPLDAPLDATQAADASIADTSVPSDTLADVSCAPGQVRCGALCVNTQEDTTNCGACGFRCDALPGVRAEEVRCEGGRCVLAGACAQDRANCDRDVTNGCEVDLTTNLNCGACGNACSGGTPVCAMRAVDGGTVRLCSNGCDPSAPTRCGMSCVDTDQSPAHCGGCDRRCTVPRATAGCAAGRCTVASCEQGFLDCDGDATNGCEVEGTSSVTHCGACGRACPSVPNGRPSCAAGTCTAVCNDGHHLCNGACVPNTAPTSCGSSCAPCPAPTNATATCENGVCGFRCNSGFHQCGSGCAADDNDALCGPLCENCYRMPISNGTWRCQMNQCTPRCMTGYHGCGLQCVSNNSPATCGSSCTPCPQPANGSATCTGGTCGIVCGPGYHACGDRCLANYDVQGCGTSCTPCPVPANGAATCDGTTCGVRCNAGFIASGSACALAPAVPLSPLSGMRVTHRRPRLRWTLNGGASPVTVRLCRDRALTQSCGTIMANALEAAPSTDLAPGAWFWRIERGEGSTPVTSATWEFFVGRRSAAQNLSWGPVPDFNGDGFADVIASSENTHPVNVYHGSSRGIDSSPSYTLGNYYGALIAAAGDVNGDGFGDAIVGNGGSSIVDIYLGGPLGLGRSYALRLTGGNLWGRLVAGAGDVNGDGYGDVIIADFQSAWLYFGSPTGLNTSRPSVITSPSDAQSFAEIRRPFAAADFDGDGFSDVVIVGGTRFSGVLFVYRGSSFGIGAIPVRLEYCSPSESYNRVDVAGDANADGYPDLAVTACGTRYGVEVFLGGPTLATRPAVRITPRDVGRVAGVGDVNGDGFDDLLIGDAGSEAYLYLGSGPSLSFGSVGTLSGPVYFGRDMAGAGDVNGDGYDDFAIGGSEYVRIYLGAPGGVGAVLPDLRSNLPGFGWSVAGLTWPLRGLKAIRRAGG